MRTNLLQTHKDGWDELLPQSLNTGLLLACSQHRVTYGEDRGGQTANIFGTAGIWAPLWSVVTTQVKGSILWSSLTQSPCTFCPRMLPRLLSRGFLIVKPSHHTLKYMLEVPCPKCSACSSWGYWLWISKFTSQSLSLWSSRMMVGAWPHQALWWFSCKHLCDWVIMGDSETLNVLLSNIQQQLVNPSTGFDKIQIQPNSLLLKQCGHIWFFK